MTSCLSKWAETHLGASVACNPRIYRHFISDIFFVICVFFFRFSYSSIKIFCVSFGLYSIISYFVSNQRVRIFHSYFLYLSFFRVR
ncbi:hypothetical protein V1512DRAFT_263532 [Lipomyces arxii]|uniref:uncharacterized protein n=1 Tax=Lipomyces arxii TaxID=56418 RepID=UPI0034CF9982